MKFRSLDLPEKRKHADVLVIPFWKKKEKVQAAFPLDKKLLKLIQPSLESKDFKAKEGEVAFIYLEEGLEKRVALLGLGSREKATSETLRIAYGSLTKKLLPKKIKSINCLLPLHEKMGEEELLRGVIEGTLLPNYVFKGYKKQKKEDGEEPLLEEITWIGSQAQTLELAHKTQTICEAVYFARDLVNGNADLITPQYLAQCALELEKKQPHVKTTLFDKKRIKKEKLNLLLAVNRGCTIDPVFIMTEYRGDPGSDKKTVLVGKGVTYDTGGLNLKPTGSMETMKCDMAGAAACLGVLKAVSQLKLKINVTLLIPSTENAIDANSFKPGDVYSSYSGDTVEMTNSDAEGRLILADALAYAVKNLKPTYLIDIATLTGAIDVALGSEASGLMSTDDELAARLQQAAETTHERLWRMPLYEEYKERLKSDIADLKSWNGRSGSANVAATFLRHFVKDTVAWAHLDIASTAYVTEAKKYLPKYATGFGVRLLVDFLEKLSLSPPPAKRKKKATPT